MKTSSTILAAIFATTALLATGAHAATDKTKEPSASAPAAQTMPMKKHSHMDEKGGMVLNTAEPKSEQSKPATNAHKHYHPRDGK